VAKPLCGPALRDCIHCVLNRAWIAERKDVLSAMFWLLAMWSYLGYTSNKTPRPAHATVNYWLALLCTALGLMSKPMV